MEYTVYSEKNVTDLDLETMEWHCKFQTTNMNFIKSQTSLCSSKYLEAMMSKL